MGFLFDDMADSPAADRLLFHQKRRQDLHSPPVTGLIQKVLGPVQDPFEQPFAAGGATGPLAGQFHAPAQIILGAPKIRFSQAANFRRNPRQHDLDFPVQPVIGRTAFSLLKLANSGETTPGPDGDFLDRSSQNKCHNRMSRFVRGGAQGIFLGLNLFRRRVLGQIVLVWLQGTDLA